MGKSTTTSPKTLSHAQGKGCIRHNNRDFFSPNVDKTRTKDNITYVKQPLRDAYDELFSGALEQYNAKQTRPERRKSDYFEDCFGVPFTEKRVQAKNNEYSFYEDVVGIGDKYDTAVGTVDGEIAKACLDEYMRGFQERNPHFHVFNAVMHLDESTPHLHIDFVPFADGYKNGLNTRNSLTKALQQMGFGKSKDAISKWRIAERAVLREICERHGLVIAEEKPSRGATLSREQIGVIKEQERIIKEQGEEMEAQELEIQDLERDIKAREAVIASQSEKIAQLEQESQKKRDDFLELLEKRDSTKVQLSDLESQATGAENRLITAENQLDKTEKALAVTNAKKEAANKDLKKLLDRKARASEIPHRPFSEYQTYNITMLESTRAIGSESYANMDKAMKLNQDVAEREVKLQQRAEEIEPMHAKAEQELREARREREEAANLKQNEEARIEAKANEIADKAVHESFHGKPSKREERLEEFCKSLRFQDGEDGMQKFEHRERELEERTRRERERQRQRRRSIEIER